MKYSRRFIAVVPMLVLAAGFLPVRAQLSQEEIKRIQDAAPATSTVKPQQPRRLLVFNLAEGYKHSAIPRASKALEIIGKKTGAYETVLSDDISVFRPENLQKFDAVCFNNTTQLKMDDPGLRKSLLEFIANGKGIIGIHAATDNFPTWPEGQELFGGVFDGHPWTADGTWSVKIVDPRHPVTAAFQGRDFLIKDEIYRVRQINLRKNSHVLIGLDMKAERNRNASGVKRSDRDIPISWVRSYGKGRLFYCSLGHNDEVYANPAVLKHYLDGIQFAMGDLQAETTPVEFDPMKFFDPEKLAGLLRSIAAYQYGEGRGALADLNEFIRDVDDLPEARLRMEKSFLEFLRGTGTPAGKQFISTRLALVGSDESVPQLVVMLGDTATAEMALYALESLQGPGVDVALQQVLARSEGWTLIGVVNALGNHRVESATAALEPLLTHSDTRVAIAAISALGKIGTPAAFDLLDRAEQKAASNVRNSILDAMLACADRFRGAGENDRALRIYGKLNSSREPIPVRCAALRGIVFADPGNAANVISNTLRSKDVALHPTAVQLVREVPDIDNARAISRILPELPAATQVQVLASLAHYRDAVVQKVEVAAAANKRPEVRIAALRALGLSGDAGVVSILARAAAVSRGEEQKEARAALNALHAPGVDDSILAALPRTDSKTKVELLKSIGVRNISSGAEVVLRAAKDPNGPVRIESAKALRSIAAGEHVAAIVDLLVQSRDDAQRHELELTTAVAARRIPDGTKQDEAILRAYASTEDRQTKVSLINVFGKIGAAASLSVLRTALDDKDPGIRLAAIRALSEWPTAEPFPELWQHAKSGKEPAQRILALRGCVRLIGLDTSRTAGETVKMYQDALQAAPNADERKMLLSAVGETRSVAALQLAAVYLDDKNLHLEAEAATLNIADGIARMAPPETVAGLQKLIASSTNEATVARARTMVRRLERYDDYITAWESAGPYQKAGAHLLDEPFAPEIHAGLATWTQFKDMTNPDRPWLLEFDKAFGGQNKVVYVRTGVWSPEEQKARLEVGSDDGVKIWLNGKLVHSHNAVRGVSPGDDIVPVTLQKGWTTLMMKINQLDGSWGACARVRAPDGGRLEGIRFSLNQN